MTPSRAYAGAGRFNDAIATASKGRDRALASGQNELAGSLLKLKEYYNARKPAPGGNRN